MHSCAAYYFARATTSLVTLMPTKSHFHPSDLRSGGRLVIDAVVGITDLVESMHRTISSVSAPLGKSPSGSTQGITGLVYRTVRGVTRAVGGGIDLALVPLTRLLDARESTPARDNIVAALNGVLGDYLVASNNPLAIAMQWRSDGTTLAVEKSALACAYPNASGKILVLVHGLCMSDGQWLRETGNRPHDHGAALARELGYTPIYLRYNSGQHISVNGREFAAALESLLDAWPVPVEELTILAHSMGGLLARSAHHYAETAQLRWPKKLRSLVFLGTPHHGAPLERGGHWVDILLGISPYSAPFSRLAKIRSAGITDLRFGDLRDEDWQIRGTGKRRNAAARALPLPEKTSCYAIAATTGKRKGALNDRLLGDGLVPIASALGQHVNPALNLAIPASQQWVGTEMNHMDLLASGEVYGQIGKWLKR